MASNLSPNEVSNVVSGVLDFDMAMSQFVSMFPDISQLEIEAVLRRHGGDVTTTIDELLQLPCNSATNSSANANAIITSTRSISISDKKKCDEKTPSDINEATQKRPPENCVNDEKIALLIQNREFLQYLQSDSAFMREVYGHHHSHHHRRRHHRSCHSARNCQFPIVLAASSSRIIPSPNNHRFETSYECSDGIQGNSPPPVVPDGPFIGISKNSSSIPKGPLIDYSDSKDSKWTHKFKAKLPFSSSKRSSSFMPMEEEQNDDESPNHLFNNHSQLNLTADEQQVASKLQNLGRNSKSLLHSLARKFSLSKGNAHLSSKPVDPIEFPNELIHDNASHNRYTLT